MEQHVSQQSGKPNRAGKAPVDYNCMKKIISDHRYITLPCFVYMYMQFHTLKAMSSIRENTPLFDVICMQFYRQIVLMLSIRVGFTKTTNIPDSQMKDNPPTKNQPRQPYSRVQSFFQRQKVVF